MTHYSYQLVLLSRKPIYLEFEHSGEYGNGEDDSQKAALEAELAEATDPVGLGHALTLRV